MKGISRVNGKVSERVRKGERKNQSTLASLPIAPRPALSPLNAPRPLPLSGQKLFRQIILYSASEPFFCWYQSVQSVDVSDYADLDDIVIPTRCTRSRSGVMPKTRTISGGPCLLCFSLMFQVDNFFSVLLKQGDSPSRR